MADLAVAISQSAFTWYFEEFRDAFHATHSGSGDFGDFTASYTVGAKLKGGRIDFQADNSIRINELDIVYDPLSVILGVDLLEVCVGGFCLIPNPLGGCFLRAPEICVFDSNPDITIPLDLSGMIVTEISDAFSLNTGYFVHPDRKPEMIDLDAEDAGIPNKRKLFLDPIWLDLDTIDVSDTVGNILDQAIENSIDGTLAPLPF